jgi:hypothetical protein
MALTELQRKWIADVLGVDLRKLQVAPSGQGAPSAGPVPPRPDADANSPAPANQAQEVEITIDNQSDRKLRFIKAENDGGRFNPAPPQEVAPKKKVSFAALNTGAKGGTLIYQLEAKEGAAEEPDQLSWWLMSWKPVQAGQLPQPDSKLDPELKGYSPSEGTGKDAIAFMLGGASVATQTAAKPPAAAQPTSQPNQTAGQRRIDVTFANQSDRWLKYWGADKMTATFDQKPPDVLKPGASATFAIFATGSGEIHFGLMYSIVPTAGAKPDADSPKWTPHFTIPAGTAVMVPGSDIVPGIDGLKSSENPGTDAVSFVLSGKAAASAQRPKTPQAPAGTQDVEQRVPVTFTNDSNRVLRYWGADKMDVTFEQRPPDLIKPGQSLGIVVRGKRGSPVHFGLMYSILANETEKAENATPKWLPYFNIAPGEQMIADCQIVPEIGGLKAGGWPEKDGALFVLSGKAAVSAPQQQQPQAPQAVQPKDVEQRIPVTFTNNSNVVLRYWGADKMAVTFEQRPPDLVKPGQSLGFAVRGKSGSEIHFGLMYSILANETEKAENATPKWTPHFNIPPGEQMIAYCQIIPGMGGLKTGGWPEKDGALFVLSGHWAKDQELKTAISIKNATKYKLRLAQSSAAPGRFDPAPPVEIAPRTTATCASWAKVESDQKLVYELEAADGKKGADKGTSERKRWTMTWHTKPGDSPRVESDPRGWGIDGDDGVRFELDIKDDTQTK